MDWKVNTSEERDTYVDYLLGFYNDPRYEKVNNLTFSELKSVFPGNFRDKTKTMIDPKTNPLAEESGKALRDFLVRHNLVCSLSDERLSQLINEGYGCEGIDHFKEEQEKE